jgi:hypothetical protein
MSRRRPLVSVNGRTQELPTSDTLVSSRGVLLGGLTFAELNTFGTTLTVADTGIIVYCTDVVWSGGTGCTVVWNGSQWRDPDGNVASSGLKAVPIPVFTVSNLPALSAGDEGKVAIASDARSGSSSLGGLYRWTGAAWADMFGVNAATEFEVRGNNTGSYTAVGVSNTSPFVKLCTITFTGTGRATNVLSIMNGPTAASNFALKNYAQLLFAVDVSDMNTSPTAVQLELLSFSEVLAGRFVAVLVTDTASQKVIELYYANANAAGTNRIAFEPIQSYRQSGNSLTIIHTLISGTPPTAQASLPSGTQYTCSYSPIRALEYFAGSNSVLAIGADGKLYYSGQDTDARYPLASSFTENVQDIVGALLQNSASVNVIYDDANNIITFEVVPGSASGAAGSGSQVQFNNGSGGLGASPDFAFDNSSKTLALLGANTEIVMQGITSEPAAPAADRLALYVKSIGGRMLPKIKGPSGLDTPLQPFLGGNNVRWLRPNGGTAVSVNAMPNTAVGTVSHPALAATNLRTQTARALVTSAATANAASEFRAAQTLIWRGNAAGLGGFHCIFRFAVISTTALQRLFVGLSSATTAFAVTQVIDALTNIIGVGWDSADANLRVMHNDATGVATEIDLGANFPANNTTAFYELVLFCAPNSSTVSYRVTRLDTGAEASGQITTDLPANTTFLTHHEYMNNGGTAAAVGLEIMGVYIETDY